MDSEKEREIIQVAASGTGMDTVLSRRQFLVFSGRAITVLATMDICRAWGSDSALVILDNAKGLVVADASRCVGCQRCELACTEFNDGRAQPSLARIQVGRTINFGPEGSLGRNQAQGLWGGGTFSQDICHQCPHPVPCATACPNDAILADPRTGARVVDTSRCSGCRLCLRACPWDMIRFDEESQKATKCFLCQGSPKCVEACPAGALRYVPWRNIARETAPRTAVFPVISAEKARGCLDCHLGR
ncbi:4Fe-4S dicluster domain-containing protein [Desulfatirhabdium butyrativorans]|uniref:4Fe-4S dicluster domain-containing protein n=1 Tax=Desulfatirhabdium butyrativorans TaxID=340467 RepID=UPI00055810D0|nr:4Fe-4S dicluster domain-containing protein [Desulfatirhabdium butyrativorans]